MLHRKTLYSIKKIAIEKSATACLSPAEIVLMDESFPTERLEKWYLKTGRIQNNVRISVFKKNMGTIIYIQECLETSFKNPTVIHVKNIHVTSSENW